MRKLIAIAVMFLGLNAAAQAQQPKPERARVKNITPEQRATRQTARMEKALQLTEAQKKTVYEANLAAAKELQGFKKEQEARRTKLKSIQQDRDAKLKSVLTTEQYQKMQELRTERKKKMMEKRKQRKEAKTKEMPTEQRSDK